MSLRSLLEVAPVEPDRLEDHDLRDDHAHLAGLVGLEQQARMRGRELPVAVEGMGVDTELYSGSSLPSIRYPRQDSNLGTRFRKPLLFL